MFLKRCAMKNKEAKARIKINQLLVNSGWIFFDNENAKANIQLEPNVKLTSESINSSGDNFENTPSGYVDYLLLDKKSHPIIVLEAKSEDKDPLVGKEQARRYAKSLNCKYVILSNGNLHYFWDTTSGNPYLITSFPAPESIELFQTYKPSPEKLIAEEVNEGYIASTQLPDFQNQPGWNDSEKKELIIDKNKLRLLRKYQVGAIKSLQNAVRNEKTRFLFEMATGTGKTLTSAAVIKLFLRTGNAHRVLFLVDRIELEDQAQKSFKFLLKNDYTSVIYKENKDDWKKAQIVVTTVQSLLFNNKFKLFSPTSMDKFPIFRLMNNSKNRIILSNLFMDLLSR
jgi:type I restriction enzyme R subunit